MSQSNGLSQLKRMEFEFKGTSYHFTLNPEEYQQTEPARVNITQTKGGAFGDKFGAGIQDISIKGITGFKNRTANPDDGFKKFKELQSKIREVYADDLNPNSTEELKYYNYTDEEYWVVYPERFALMRSKSRPLLYQYDIKLICLKKISQAKPYSGRVGNPYRISKTSKTATNGGYTGSLRYPKVGEVTVITDGGYTGSLSNSNIRPSQNGRNNLSETMRDTENQSDVELIKDISTQTQTREKALNQAAENFSAVVGGENGMFSPMMIKYVTKDMSLLDNGVVPNIPDYSSIFDGVDSLIFIPQVSSYSTKVFNSCKSWTPNVVLLEKFFYLISDYINKSVTQVTTSELASLIINSSNGVVDSTLVDAIKSEEKLLTLSTIKILKTILIDTMGLYKDVRDYIDGKKNSVQSSVEDISRLVGNVKYIRAVLEDSNLGKPLNVIEELRNLQQNLLITKLEKSGE